MNKYGYERIVFDDEELDWSGPGWYTCRCWDDPESGTSFIRWTQSDHGENRVYLSDPTDLMMPQEEINAAPDDWKRYDATDYTAQADYYDGVSRGQHD